MTKDTDRVQELIAARKAAEKVVEGMPDGPLKEKTFEVALHDLLSGSQAVSPAPTPEPAGRKARRAPKRKGAVKRSRTGKAPRTHLRELIDEKFFAAERSLSAIVQRLKELGHNYKPNELSSHLGKLTKLKELKRKRGSRDDGRKVWVYRT